MTDTPQKKHANRLSGILTVHVDGYKQIRPKNGTPFVVALLSREHSYPSGDTVTYTMQARLTKASQGKLAGKQIDAQLRVETNKGYISFVLQSAKKTEVGTESNSFSIEAVGKVVENKSDDNYPHIIVKPVPSEHDPTGLALPDCKYKIDYPSAKGKYSESIPYYEDVEAGSTIFIAAYVNFVAYGEKKEKCFPKLSACYLDVIADPEGNAVESSAGSKVEKELTLGPDELDEFGLEDDRDEAALTSEDFDPDVEDLPF